MANKIIFGLLAVMVVAFACTSPTADTTTDTPTDMEAPGPSAEGAEPDAVFRLAGENFAFYQGDERNPTLAVQEGDLVRIEFESTEGFHDWVLDEFGASTERVRETDGMTAVEFVADQAGTYEYYCSVGSHRVNGMFGTFVVE